VRAGTIVASNYLEMARLLGRSFLDRHPGDRFVVLVVDDREIDTADDDSGIEIARLADLSLGQDDLDRMRTIYDVMELSTAVKPAFLSMLLEHDDIVAYIDPDIYVYRPFTDLVEAARTVGIVLTPHVLSPIPRDGKAPTERNIMQSGIFNLGFIAVGQPARGFLDWWQERLLVDAVSDVEANLFTDQRWIDWVPALFDHVVCRDPGMNIAWWNVHERRLERRDGEILANGAPVRFVHFSGYSPTAPDTLSKHQVPSPRTAHERDLVIRELAEEYGAELLASGHADRIGLPYQWSETPDGIPLTPVVRAIVRAELLGGARTGCEVAGIDTSVPMAFGSTASAFPGWLEEPVAGSASIRFTRIEAGLWEQRPDLRAAFPDRDGADAGRYRHWLDHDPSVPVALPGLATPRPPAGADVPRAGWLARARGLAGRVVRPMVARVR
jgi:hypothetical protein